MTTSEPSIPSLNADQQQGLASISAFILGDEKEFFLTGAPGVGKTFTTREIVKQIPKILSDYANAMGKKDIRIPEICLTSTTNKAAAVLSEQTGQPAITIHSFLGVVPKNNFRTGRTSLQKKGNWKVHSHKIIMIDEASMINAELHRLIHEGTDNTCKVIYIGDKNQLAPVREKLSKAVALADDPDRHYEITTPVRNSGSAALLDLCERLRADIEGEIEKANLTHWHESMSQYGTNDIEWIDGPEFQSLLQTKFGPGGEVQATDPYLKGRVLCYTNRAVIGYNQHIRAMRGLPTEPTVGEMLIANRNIELGRGRMINVEEPVEIMAVGVTPEDVWIDQHNFIQAYPLEISTPYVGRAEVMIPADMDRFRVVQNHFKKHKDWFNFYGMNDKFVDLRDREASTVYKAQGSTYDFVIMVMNDIFSSRDIAQLRRMLYVGASRAKQKVFVYDSDIHNKPRSIYQ